MSLTLTLSLVDCVDGIFKSLASFSRGKFSIMLSEYGVNSVVVSDAMDIGLRNMFTCSVPL